MYSFFCKLLHTLHRKKTIAMNNLIEQLKNILKAKGITHQEVAEKINSSRQNVNRMLQGDDMKISVFVKICIEFDILSSDFCKDGSRIIDILSLPERIQAKEEIKVLKELLRTKEDQSKLIESLRETIKDKELIIQLLKK